MHDKLQEDHVPPLVVHVIFRLAVGGLENGLVNLVNTMPRECCRHAIVCMTDHTDFSRRIRRPDVEVYDLHKRPGKDFRVYFELWKLFRKLKLCGNEKSRLAAGFVGNVSVAILSVNHPSASGAIPSVPGHPGKGSRSAAPPAWPDQFLRQFRHNSRIRHRQGGSGPCRSC